MALFIYDKNEQFLGVFFHVFSPTTPAQSEKTVRCHPIGSAMNGSVDELMAAGKSTMVNHQKMVVKNSYVSMFTRSGS